MITPAPFKSFLLHVLVPDNMPAKQAANFISESLEFEKRFPTGRSAIDVAQGSIAPRLLPQSRPVNFTIANGGSMVACA